MFVQAFSGENSNQEGVAFGSFVMCWSNKAIELLDTRIELLSK